MTEDGDRQVLIAAYQVAHAEKLFSSRAMLQRATLFLAINSALLGFVASSGSDPRQAVRILLLGVLCVANLGWFFVNERNRAYVRYYVDHLARLEHLLTEGEPEEAGPRVFLDMPRFARGKGITIRPADDGHEAEETRIWCTARVVRVERVFSAFGLLFAMTDLGVILWLVHTGG